MDTNNPENPAIDLNTENSTNNSAVLQFPAMLEIDPDNGVSQSEALMLASMIEATPEHFTNVSAVLRLGRTIKAMAQELPATGVAPDGLVPLFAVADQPAANGILNEPRA